MDIKDIEILLTEINKEEILPSDELVAITKKRIKSQKNPIYLIGILLILNLWSLLSGAYFITTNLSIITISIVFFIASSITNLLIGLIYLNKEHVKSFFINIEADNNLGVKI